MNAEIHLFRVAPDLFQQRHRAHLAGLRSHHAGNAPIVCLMVFLHKAHRIGEFFVFPCRVKLPKRRILHTIGHGRQAVDHLGRYHARTCRDMIFNQLKHGEVIIAEGCGAFFYSFDDIQHRTGNQILCFSQTEKRKDTTVHPFCDILAPPRTIALDV